MKLRLLFKKAIALVFIYAGLRAVFAAVSVGSEIKAYFSFCGVLYFIWIFLNDELFALKSATDMKLADTCRNNILYLSSLLMGVALLAFATRQ